MFTKKIIRKLQMKNLAFDGMFSGELLFDWSCLQNIKNCFSAKNGGDGLWWKDNKEENVISILKFSFPVYYIYDPIPGVFHLIQFRKLLWCSTSGKQTKKVSPPRETREGWSLLTVETEVNRNSVGTYALSTQFKICFLVPQEKRVINFPHGNLTMEISKCRPCKKQNKIFA